MPDDDGDPSYRVVGVKHRKNNNGPLSPDMAFRFGFGDLETTVERVAATQVDEIEKAQSLPQRIRALLDNGAMWVHEVATDLEASNKDVSNALNRGKGKMFTLVERQGKSSKWGLLHSSSSFPTATGDDDE